MSFPFTPIAPWSCVRGAAAPPSRRRGFALLGVWIARSTQRAALRALVRADVLAAETRLLRDVGISPADGWREGAKWFWQS
jgi:uncharacterized protein YjiS (DUF1127 family)